MEKYIFYLSLLLKERIRIVKIYMVKFNVIVLDRLKIMRVL